MSTQLVGLVLAAAAAVVTARALGPGGQGELQVAQTLATTGAQIVAISVPITAIQLIAQRRAGAGVVVRAAMGITATTGLAFVLVVAAVARPVADVLLPDRSDGASLLILAAGLAALYALQQSILAAARGRNDFVRYNRLVLIGKLLSAGALVLAMVADHPSAARGVLALVGANVAFTLAVAWQAHRTDPFVSPGHPGTTSTLLRSNLPAYGGTLVQEVAYRADILLLAALAAPRQVGFYAVAILTAELLWQLPNAVGLVLLSRAAGDDNEAPSSRLLTTLSAGTALALVVAGLGVGVAAPIVVPAVLGRDYEAAVGPLIALLPGIVALGIWKVVVNDLVGRGHSAVKLQSAAVGAVLVVVLDLVLIPSHGALGAALASSVAYAGAAIAAVRSASRILDVDPWAFVRPDAATRAALRE